MKKSENKKWPGVRAKILTSIYSGGVGHCMDEGNVLMNAGVFLGKTREARERERSDRGM